MFIHIGDHIVNADKTEYIRRYAWNKDGVEMYSISFETGDGFCLVSIEYKDRNERDTVFNAVIKIIQAQSI